MERIDERDLLELAIEGCRSCTGPLLPRLEVRDFDLLLKLLNVGVLLCEELGLESSAASGLNDAFLSLSFALKGPGAIEFKREKTLSLPLGRGLSGAKLGSDSG